MTRLDFGTYLFLLHYARCWQIHRGDVRVVILTSKGQLVKRLAQSLCPEVQLIFADFLLKDWLPRLFGHENIQHLTLNPLYCRIAARWPYALFIYDQPIDIDLMESVSNYVKYFDENIAVTNKNEDFKNAYLNIREVLDYRVRVFKDMIDLHYATDHSKKISNLESLNDLKKHLKIENKYVCLNINCKDYRNKSQNIRTITQPERYNALIDFLISLGFSVVIQGRAEQPLFVPRKNLIDYSKSPFASIENDLILYSGCDFGILSKTGAEVFGTVCNVPILGLNYTELCSMQPNLKFRYFPKRIWNNKLHRFVTWREQLNSPCFFDLGKRSYHPDLEYLELEESELIDATQEFIKLLTLPEEGWLNYTVNQNEFKKELTPLHLDIFLIKGAPCEAYFRDWNDPGVL